MIHLFIPDTQSRPGTPDDHLRWIGKFIVEKKPDVVIHAGDHWDCPSLSSFDKKGSKSMEGRRYEADIEKGNADFALLTEPIVKHNKRHRLHPYEPRLVLLRGNHEYRIIRAVEDNPQLDGVIGYHHLLSPGWETHDFLKPVWIDGVAYCHYFANPMTGKPYGGMVRTRLNTIGHSFTQGHTQTLDMANRPVLGPTGPRLQYGLVAGACYLHDEDYKGYQGNAHWRGIVVKHEVRDGAYDIMPVSLDYLCRRFEGVPLTDFMAETYPDITN